MSSDRPLNIAIIGGGIGGLSLLLGLLQHASPSIICPRIYESAPAFSEIGAGVGFGPNSVAAMGLISASLKEAYVRIANDADVVEMERDGKKEKFAVWNHIRMGCDGKGEGNVDSLKAGDTITRVLFKNWKKNVHRARFLEEMVRLLPAGEEERFVSFKKRCVDIVDASKEENRGRKGVKILFADGTSVIADAAIGCDGVKSRTRQILLSKIGDEENIRPRFTGKYAYRGLIPMEQAIEALGEVSRTSQIICGYDGHLVCFPIDQGKTLNVVAFQTKKDGKWEHDEWVIPGTVEQAVDEFQGFSDGIKKLLGGLKKPDVWALFEHPPATSYTDGEGTLCLLGDCAHASTPHQGAGAGMAIEDAAVLSHLLGSLTTTDRHGLKKSFQAYDAVRRIRSQRLVTTSRDAGNLYEFQKDGVLDDASLLGKDVQERMRWIWNVDLDEQVKEGLKLMES